MGSKGGDADLYGYCCDDPVNLVDPSGLRIMGSASAAKVAAPLDLAKAADRVAHNPAKVGMERSQGPEVHGEENRYLGMRTRSILGPEGERSLAQSRPGPPPRPLRRLAAKPRFKSIRTPSTYARHGGHARNGSSLGCLVFLSADNGQPFPAPRGKDGRFGGAALGAGRRSTS